MMTFTKLCPYKKIVNKFIYMVRYCILYPTRANKNCILKSYQLNCLAIIIKAEDKNF